MSKTIVFVTLLAVMILSANTSFAQDQPSMSFFITSSGPGNGANLGALDGADARCQLLARSVGQGDAHWHAYLSTQGSEAVNARDRIGAGPWYNANGVMVAANLEELHGDNNLTAETQVNENGTLIRGRGMTPNRHDIITGSTLDGMAFEPGADRTCGNWTSEGSNGSARVGHFDREGGGENATSWNSAHDSRGCSQEALQGTGGDGLFYCFAVD
jgi:hypothetical protein